MSSGSADEAIALRNTFVVLALDETDHASTPSGVFVGFAVRVRTTWYVVTGVHASAANACEDVIAVVIGGALVLRNSDSGATSAVRIADGTSGAFADVIALGVDAVGVVAAGVVRALVHIHATVLGISFVTSLAHAPGRVARCAFCVDATWEPVARILAKVTIQSVRIERWWTNAFTRLHALLVRFAFVVAGAPLLSR